MLLISFSMIQNIISDIFVTGKKQCLFSFLKLCVSFFSDWLSLFLHTPNYLSTCDRLIPGDWICLPSICISSIYLPSIYNSTSIFLSVIYCCIIYLHSASVYLFIFYMYIWLLYIIYLTSIYLSFIYLTTIYLYTINSILIYLPTSCRPGPPSFCMPFICLCRLSIFISFI